MAIKSSRGVTSGKGIPQGREGALPRAHYQGPKQCKAIIDNTLATPCPAKDVLDWFD